MKLDISKLTEDQKAEVARFIEDQQRSLFIPANAPEFVMGNPGTSQLDQINRYRPKGSAEYSSSELVTIPWIASHNLITYGGDWCWHPDALQQMADKALGKPFMVDHEWEEVENIVGFIYDARVLTSSQVPDEIMYAANGAYRDKNQDILDRYSGEYAYLVIQSAHKATSSFVEAVRYNQIRDCSTGCLLTGIENYLCPICSDDHGEDVSFVDDRCPHLMPSPYLSWFVDLSDPNVRKLVAPYSIKTGVAEFVELSAVVDGALPGARVFSEVS